MTVLITRPRDDSEILASLLEKDGIDCFIEPMFHIKHLPFDFRDQGFGKVQGTIFTSRHAVSSMPDYAELPCFVVGKSTGRMATQRGFTNVVIADGNLEDLLAEVESKYKNDSGVLLYFRGEEATLDLTEFFKPKNINILSVIVYKTEETTTLSEALAAKILAYDIKTAIFSSDNTVKIFIKRLKELSLLEASNKIACFAISEKVAKTLGEGGFNIVKVFNNDMTQLITLIKKN